MSGRVLTPVEFYFLRHGQTDWNRDGRVQGQTDVPLNQVGLAQARTAARRVAGLPIATIFSSPLSRALNTAEILRAAIGCDIEIIDDLRECTWGARDGHLKAQWYEDWKAGHSLPDGAESFDGFVKRALDAINRTLAHPGPVLIVAHGGVYWAVRKHAELVRTSDVPNAIPIHHLPPGADRPRWTATDLR